MDLSLVSVFLFRGCDGKFVEIILKINGRILPKLLQIRQHFIRIEVSVVWIGGHRFHSDGLQCLRD